MITSFNEILRKSSRWTFRRSNTRLRLIYRTNLVHSLHFFIAACVQLKCTAQLELVTDEWRRNATIHDSTDIRTFIQLDDSSVGASCCLFFSAFFYELDDLFWLHMQSINTYDTVKYYWDGQ